MRQRNSTENSVKPIIRNRRSPRFLQKNQPEKQCLMTLNPVRKKNRVPFSDLTTLSSRPVGDSLRKGGISDKAKGTKETTGPRRSTRLNGGVDNLNGIRRSPRFSQNGNVDRVVSDKCKLEPSSKVSETSNQVDMKRKSATEKRVTWRSIRGCDNGGVSGNRKVCDGVTSKCISDKGKFKRGVNLSEQCTYKIEKRLTRSASRQLKDDHSSRIGNVECGEVIRNVPFGCLDKRAFSDVGKDKLGAISLRKPTSDSENMTTNVSSADLGGGKDRRGGIEAEKKLSGAKRKNTQVEKEHKMFQGWTAAQELALERAYFAAKPTPHFWKKVAKMVPGKSAKECFDKINSELLTPAQQQPRSRAKGLNMSLSLSASKLLNTSEPETKKSRYTKQESHRTRRTIRHLLLKQKNIDHDYEADLFNVLEPTLDVYIQPDWDKGLLSSPKLKKEGLGLDKRCLEISFSAHRKLLSQSNDSCGSTVISPPVLKKIKNKALHEKYINQLHSRGARRKTASLRARRFTKYKSDDKEDNVKQSESVKNAKNALVFCVTDAIKQLHHLQSSPANKFYDTFYDFAYSSDDDIEDEC